MSFVDRVEVKFQAGRGGDGSVSFHHEKFKAKGGPDGGDGGHGGDVVVVASRNQNTLADFRFKKLLKAEDGQPGRERKKHGKSGQKMEIKVPVGTVLATADGEVVADLVGDGQQQVVVKGGRGGFGNAHFVSSRRQAPRVAEKGEPGEALSLVMELKMLADVGLVGLPNAGKSTLLSVISNAKPEIADYPFTTLQPHLGVVDIDKHDTLLFADIPGLIAGASQGKGLGDEFLRHIERTSVLIHLIDAYNTDIKAAYQTIMRELADYKVDLSRRPQIVVLTKTEGLKAAELASETQQLKKLVPRGTPVLAISSLSNAGLNELLRKAVAMVEKARAAQSPADQTEQLPVIGLKTDDDSWSVTKEGHKFVVTGAKIERFAQRTRFGDYHGEQRLRDIMAKLGIMDELQRQGIETEQSIIIGQPVVGELQY